MLFIVMEFIPGKDLKQLIRERGRFTVEAGIPLIIQACAGLGYAHRAGLVHCDVKPHNMLVSPDGRLKVTDFGIARALASITPGEKTDIVWGSPLYFAPEQARGEALSPASDVYSIGVVMYELLCGTPPFTASTPSELARLHISARPIPIREYIPEIPTALEEIIMKVLSKEPSARYRTADQLGRVLLKFGTLPDTPVAPVARPAPEPVREMPQPPRQVVQPEPLPRYTPEPEPMVEETESAFEEIDWRTVGLGLLALLAVGGLIPFWMMVYFAYNPPVR
jgi:serine/threonine-protein kinase